MVLEEVREDLSWRGEGEKGYTTGRVGKRERERLGFETRGKGKRESSLKLYGR